MPVAVFLWLAGSFFTSISINTTLLRLYFDDKVEHPSQVSLFFNVVLSLVGGIFIILFMGIPGIWIALAFILFNGFCFILAVFFTKKRTVYALEYGEKLLVSLKTIDLHICHIFEEWYEGNSENLAEPIIRSIRFVLSELPHALGLDASHKPAISVMIPQNDRFEVIGDDSIESFRIQEMEERFRYGPNPVSVAGYAMHQRRIIVLNDLSNENDENAKHWIRTFRDEPKKGSLVAFPIVRGLASEETEPIAILCVASIKKDAFKDVNTLVRILTYFAIKIEILQNCMDLTGYSRPGV
jgi:hypothetical protein